MGRNHHDTAALLDSIRALAKKGIEVHDVTQGLIEVQTSNGLLTTGMHGLVAEHYRVLVSEKTRAALRRLRATGRRYSNMVPFGWRASVDGRRLEPEPTEQAALALIRQLAPGRSLWGLSAALAERGVFQRNGRPWQAKSLSRLLSDRTIGQSALA
jgi:DNA invertase Pin-like site-specific DNA recombinase